MNFKCWVQVPIPGNKWRSVKDSQGFSEKVPMFLSSIVEQTTCSGFLGGFLCLVLFSIHPDL